MNVPPNVVNTSTTNGTTRFDIKLCGDTQQGMRSINTDKTFAELTPSDISALSKPDGNISTERKKDTVTFSYINEDSLYLDTLKYAKMEYCSSEMARVVISEALGRDTYLNFNSRLGLTEADIAERVGGIGRALDEAYARQQFTDEDFAVLNKELDIYAEKLAARSETAIAGRQAIKDNWWLRMFGGVSPQEYRDELSSSKAHYLDLNNKGSCLLDRELLAQLIDSARYGV